jgi:hypothetical protein
MKLSLDQEVALCNNFRPEPKSSQSLVEATEKPARMGSERQVRLSPFLEADLFLIFAEPSSGELYAPETEWPALTSKQLAFERLKQCDDAAYVIFRPARGTPRDVSEEFARIWLHELVAEGWDPELESTPRFVSRHAVNIDIEQCLTEQREEAHLARQIRSLESPRRI